MNFEKYNPRLKELARQLRNKSTKAEIILWQHLRGKQLLELDFHRQKPLGNYIVDFYCPTAHLVIEVDGYSHRNIETLEKDRKKQEYLAGKGMVVLRVSNEEVTQNIDGVLRKIEHLVTFQKS